eukprot:3814382-Prymnesium_polylepis.1
MSSLSPACRPRRPHPSSLHLTLCTQLAGPNALRSARLQVLDQFERNEEQQQFIMTIFEKIDERSRSTPEAFGEIQLTVISDVCQNGVETLASVSGEGMALASAAMTTLLQTYIAEREPVEWKKLFKEVPRLLRPEPAHSLDPSQLLPHALSAALSLS